MRHSLEKITIHSVVIAILAAFFFFIAPITVGAQADSQDLGAAISAALLSDARSAEVAPAQFDALVAALTAEAIQQGISVHDITWNRIAPMVDATSEAETCDSSLCVLNAAFGFSGPNILIPFLLGLSSALLLLIIGLMKRMHRTPIAVSTVSPPGRVR